MSAAAKQKEPPNGNGADGNEPPLDDDSYKLRLRDLLKKLPAWRLFIWPLLAIGIPGLFAVLQQVVKGGWEFKCVVLCVTLISSVAAFVYWNRIDGDVKERIGRFHPYLVLWLVPPTSWVSVIGLSPGSEFFTPIIENVSSINLKLVLGIGVWTVLVLAAWVRNRRLRLFLLLLWLAPTILFLIAVKASVRPFAFFTGSLVVLLAASWSAIMFGWWMAELKNKNVSVAISDEEAKRINELKRHPWLPFSLLSLLPPVAYVTASWPIDDADKDVLLFTICWGMAVFCLWVGYGQGGAHKKSFAKHKPIWIVFAFILLAALLGNYFSYNIVRNRVDSLQGNVALLISTTSGPDDSLEHWVRTGFKAASDLKDALDSAEPGEIVEECQRTINQCMPKLMSIANRVNLLATSLKQEEERRRQSTGASARQSEEQARLEREAQQGRPSVDRLAIVTGGLAETTRELEQSLKGMTTAKEALASGGNYSALQEKAGELANRYSDAKRHTEDLKTTLTAMEVNRLAPFILVSVLFNIFLLFPWALLFLFLFRNKSFLVNEKIYLLKDMQLDEKLLKRCPIPDRSEVAADSAYDQQPYPDLELAINKLAFRNGEYVISLVIFTAMTAAILYFFFFPHATPGLAQMISDGGGVEGFASYLIDSATPITFGFIGAYFFVINMLLRRYFASDLNPKAYTNAVARLLTVFIFGIVIQLMANLSMEPRLDMKTASVVTFVIGIFPMTGLRWISRTANRIVVFLNAPEYIDRCPLTRLDGLNIWHESRLLEERVESVQNLATAPLEELIIHTNFSALQLMDWVDQAILYVHMQEKWSGAFQNVGIRTASNLLDNVPCDKDEDARLKRAQSLADAINAAQVNPDLNGHAPRAAGKAVRDSAGELAAMADDIRDVVSRLDKDKPETLDAVATLQTRLTKLAEQAKLIRDETMKELSDAASKLAPEGAEEVSKAREAVAALRKASEALYEQVAAAQAVKKLDRTRPETLDNIADLKQKISAAWAATTEVKERAMAAAQAAGHGDAGGAAAQEWALLLAAAGAAVEAAGQASHTAQAAKELASTMDKNRPESLSIIGLIQDRLDSLRKAAAEIQTRTEEGGRALQKGQGRSSPGPQAGPRQKKEVRDKLRQIDDPVKTLMTATTDASNAAAAIDLNSQAADKLAALNDAVASVCAAASEVEEASAEAASAIQTACVTPQITREIVLAMATTVQKYPNVKRLQSYWKGLDQLQ